MALMGYWRRQSSTRRSGRAAEGGGLENRYLASLRDAMTPRQNDS
jgi:hypothetical protein